MKKYVIKLNGKVYELEMEEVIGEVAVTETIKPQPVLEKNNMKETTQTSGGEVVGAPMPGNILDVYVKVGDMVKKGQTLLILEAMKMENEIVSPIDGQVVSINISKGESVNPGQTLIQIA